MKIPGEPERSTALKGLPSIPAMYGGGLTETTDDYLKPNAIERSY